MQDVQTTTAVISVLAVTPVSGGGRLLALADVELVLAGAALMIHGVQVRADAGKTEISLPRYRTASGEWRSAITLPVELRGPMGDAVIAAAVEAGILRERQVADCPL